MTIGELDELQRRSGKIERLKHEISVLEEEGMGEAGKKKKSRSEFHLIKVS